MASCRDSLGQPLVTGATLRIAALPGAGFREARMLTVDCAQMVAERCGIGNSAARDGLYPRGLQRSVGHFGSFAAWALSLLR